MFFKKTTPRRFNYNPIYYREEKDQTVQKRQIRLKRLKSGRGNLVSVIWLIALFGIVLYIYFLLQNI